MAERLESDATWPQGLGSIRGQDRAVDALRRAAESGRVHHAYLLTGPDGVGKRTCGMALAQGLNCRREPGVGCGTCRTCTRIAEGMDPDLVLVEPEGKWIRVDQVREVLRRCELGPHESSALVVLVEPADAMNSAAQNALLKSLEEPRPGVVFCLVTSAPHRLAATVRSRCQIVRFGPLPEETVAGLLVDRAGVGQDEADRMAELAEGSVARALYLFERRAREDLVRLEDQLWDLARGAELSQALDLAKELAELGEEFVPFLELCRLEVRMELRRLLGRAAGPARLGLPPRALVAWERGFSEARRRLEANGNKRLVAEFLVDRLSGTAQMAGWQVEAP